MTHENIKQIITFLIAEECIFQKTHSNDYTNSPRPTYNFLVMQEGKAQLVIDNQPFSISENEVVWIPKNSKYAVEWIGSPVRFSVLHFDFASSYDPFFQRQSAIQILDFNGANGTNNIDGIVKDFAYLKEHGIEHYLSLSVFYRIFAQLYPLIKQSDKQDNLRKIIKPAIDYIETHYREKFPIKTLSDLCFLSSSRFEHLFKKIMGVSPVNYKNNLVVQHIQRELITDQNVSVQALAERYSFESTVYFCRLFKTATGLTPSQYRKRNRLI